MVASSSAVSRTDLELTTPAGHLYGSADPSHLGDVQPALVLDEERLRDRGEVVDAECTRLRHPVVNVELYFGRDVADRPRGLDRNDDMKALLWLPGGSGRGRGGAERSADSAHQTSPRATTVLLRSRRPQDPQRRRRAPEAVGTCRPPRWLRRALTRRRRSSTATLFVST